MHYNLIEKRKTASKQETKQSKYWKEYLIWKKKQKSEKAGSKTTHEIPQGYFKGLEKNVQLEIEKTAQMKFERNQLSPKQNKGASNLQEICKSQNIRHWCAVIDEHF